MGSGLVGATVGHGEENREGSMTGIWDILGIMLFSHLAIPSSQLRGKGKLLLEEDVEEAREEARRRGKTATIAILVMYSILVMMLLFIPRISRWFWWIIPLLIAGGVITVISSNVQTKRQLRPLRIYENGFEVPLGKRMIFYSFGEITKMREQRNPFTKETDYVCQTGMWSNFFYLRKSMRGLDEIIESIKLKIGRPEYKVEIEPSEEEKALSRKYEKSVYLTSFLGGFLLIVLLTIGFYLGVLPPSYFIFDVMLVSSVLTMIIVIFMTVFMTKMKKFAPRRLNVKIPAAMIMVLLAYSLISMGMSDVIIQGRYQTHENIGPKPTTSFVASGSYNNANLIVEGNILVDSGDTLRFRDSTILMNLSFDGEFGIWVAQGGTLILENTSIESSWYQFGYTFEIMGSATIIGSDISGVWGDLDNVNFDGGLEIYSSDVLIEDSHIRNGTTNNIFIMNSNPKIINTTIINTRDDCIEMQNSKATIVNNTIRDCGWGIIVARESDAIIRGNEIIWNEHGIYVGGFSNPTIEDNVFDYNKRYAIEYDGGSNPSIRSNTFGMNGIDIKREGRLIGSELCAPVTIIVATVCLSILYWVYREEMRKESETKD